MKFRKQAVTILSKNRTGNDLKKAKVMEKKIWKYGKSIHPRIIRLLLSNKNMTVERAYSLLTKKISIEKIKENEDDQYVVEGEVTCVKCGGKKVTKSELQTRGMDESTTSFYRCIKCSHRWKC